MKVREQLKPWQTGGTRITKGLFDALQIGTLTCSVDVMRLLLWHRLLKRVVGGSEDNYGMDAYYTKQDITLGSSRSRNDEL